MGGTSKQAMAQGEAIEEGQNLKEEAATVLKWERLAAVDRQDSRRFDLARTGTDSRRPSWKGQEDAGGRQSWPPPGKQ